MGWYCPANIHPDERVLKTSWRRLSFSSLSSEDVFNTASRGLHQDEYIRPTHMSSEDVFKTSSRRPQEVFKASSRCLQDVLKTNSRCLQDPLQRSLQDVFKMYHQVKLFLLTHFQNDFEMYSKSLWDVLQRGLSLEGFA